MIEVGIGFFVSLLALISIVLIGTSPRLPPLSRLPAAVLTPGLFAMSVYGFDHVIFIDDVADGINHVERAAFAAEHAAAGLLLFSVELSMAITLVLKSQVHCKWRYIAFAIILVGSYSRGIRLKDYPVVKNIIVGSAYAVFAVVLPCRMVSLQGQLSSLRLCLTIAAMFLLGFGGSVQSDAWDMDGDAEQGTVTIPVLCGKEFATSMASMAFVGWGALLGFSLASRIWEAVRSKHHRLYGFTQQLGDRHS